METASTKYKKSKRISTKSILCFSLLSLLYFSASAQQKTAQIKELSIFTNPLFIGLFSIAILLLLVIIVFAYLLHSSINYKIEKENKGKISNGIKTLIILFSISGFSNSLSAQSTATSLVAETQNAYWGLGGTTFYLMVSIIALEVFIAIILYNISMQLLGMEERNRIESEKKAKANIKQVSFLEKLNASVAIEEEADIMLDHNYDGIRELDNNLPPWWKYGFYITIVWGVIYLIHFHVTKTGKLQTAEYEEQLKKAKTELEEYRKKAANLVDENNASMLTDAESIASGKSVYMANCIACHGKDGEGTIGPNLVDDYWLHKGSIKDIFKTIKFGYPEKGMKSWQQDLPAKAINEVASYIKSIRGTNPSNAKEKQGELYTEENLNDSTKTIAKDSTEVVVIQK